MKHRTGESVGRGLVSVEMAFEFVQSWSARSHQTEPVYRLIFRAFCSYEAHNVPTRNTCCSCGRSDTTDACRNAANRPCTTNIHAAVKLVWRQSFGCRREYRGRRGIFTG